MKHGAENPLRGRRLQQKLCAEYIARKSAAEDAQAKCPHANILHRTVTTWDRPARVCVDCGLVERQTYLAAVAFRVFTKLDGYVKLADRQGRAVKLTTPREFLDAKRLSTFQKLSLLWR